MERISDNRPKPMKRTRRMNCRLSDDDTLTLENALLSFNGPIPQEQAWAVCHQTAKSLCLLAPHHLHELSNLNQILLHKDGHILLGLPKGIIVLLLIGIIKLKNIKFNDLLMFTDSQANYSTEKKVSLK